MRRLTREVIFDSAHLSQDLAGKSVRGGVTTMTAQGIQFVLHLVGTMVLARLLTPADFGLIGMVTVVVGFAGMFKDAGLSMATVQRDTISHEQISTLFWLNILLSAVLGLCILAASPLVAWFYGRPELTAVTAVLSLSFILTGLTIQHSALLRRHMRFGTLATIGIASYIINLIVVVLLALAGWRYWALVGGSLATALSGTFLTLFFCPWVPGRMQRRTGVRGMLKFGGHLTGFNFLNYFARNADNVLIGRFLGAGALGLYTKAYTLLMFPLVQVNAPISAVAVPVLSRLQGEPERYRSYYVKAISLIAFLTMPLVMFLIVMSKEVILVVLGSQWVDAAFVFTLLGVSALGQPVSNTAGWLYLSQGRTRDMAIWGMIGSSITVTAFVVGLPWGVTGVAASYSAFNIAAMPLFYWFLCRKGPVRARHILRAVAPSLFSSLFVLGGLLVFRMYARVSTPGLSLVLCLALTLLVTSLTLLCLPGGKAHLLQLFNVISLLRPKQYCGRLGSAVSRESAEMGAESDLPQNATTAESIY